MTNKNVWLLPTHGESIIHHDHTGFFLSENFQHSKSINSSVSGFNIYITKEDEDIKDNDFFISKNGFLCRVTYLLSVELEGASKVVLTTDKDMVYESSDVFLIKQEFLKWFVEKANDSGKPIDFAEVEKTILAYDEQGRKIDYAFEKGDYTRPTYKAIIPSDNSALSSEEPRFNLAEQSELKPTKQIDSMKLISMTNYVLDKNKKYLKGDLSLACDCLDTITYYANFLKKPIELWMFVPCYLRDGVWMPYKKDTLLSTLDLFNEFQQAQERVIFDEFRSIRERDVELINRDGWICFENNQIVFEDEFGHETRLYVVENLLEMDFKLTNSAIKQLNL